MSEGCLQRRGDNEWAVFGELSFKTVPNVIGELNGLLNSPSPQVIDLSGVTRIDSAGVALLVDWLRAARQRNVTVRFRNLPAQMLALAKVTGVGYLLPR
ncbi:MAG: STAS domain-containing protein [Gammaproteobacteria bacterium]|nr:STAS domain-containing protein [Gammaproteobacteria bacterium]MCI0591072.1 STAS domain-containing protein [Gammaproteobacteria bacterium]